MSTNIRNYEKSLTSVKFSVKEVKHFGSLLAAQLFNRITWLSDRFKNGEAIYKWFKQCDHEDCREGDTWEEEFGVSYDMFTRALGKFAQKIKRGDLKDDKALVWCWVDKYRVTWYEPNWPAINDFRDSLFGEPKPAQSQDEKANSSFPNYLSNSSPVETLKAISGNSNYLSISGNPKYLYNSSFPNYIYTDRQQNNNRESEERTPAQEIKKEPVANYQTAASQEAQERGAETKGLVNNPAFAPMFEQAKQMGLNPFQVERLALMMERPSVDFNWAINLIPAAQRPEALSDFVSKPELNHLTTGSDLRGRFRTYAKRWAAIERENRVNKSAGRYGSSKPSAVSHLKHY